jgi:hypothetical protein
MPVACERAEEVIQEAVSAEQAAGLLEWLLVKPSVDVDLAVSRPLRAINSSANICAQPRGCSWPHDDEMLAWLEDALKPAR